ncbi:hypothetical protein HYC85_008768 [Camellia sinensis]|uniref:Thioredoxin-like fold domain-containing protein n=1 Tax=Camellia sinensis TaxID=4442 RepID=A0A7J7HST3_CAMSI|nr:hypothetical protein HYC85_008768 [Camellia sinensis]
MFPRNLSRVHLFSSIFSFHCRPTNPTLTMALLALFFFFAIVRAQVTIPARLDGFVYKNGSFSVDSIMIEAFFDPVCPESRDAWPPLKQILHHYGDRLSLIVHPFALPSAVAERGGGRGGDERQRRWRRRREATEPTEDEAARDDGGGGGGGGLEEEEEEDKAARGRGADCRGKKERGIMVILFRGKNGAGDRAMKVIPVPGPKLIGDLISNAIPGPSGYHDNAFVSSRALHIVNKLKISVTYDLLELFFKHQEEFYNQPTFNVSKASIVSRIVNMATEAAGNSYYSSIAAGFTDRKTDLMTRVSFKYGCSRGVFGTPIFFVNGFPLPNGGSAIDYKTWRSIIHPLVNQLGMK